MYDIHKRLKKAEKKLNIEGDDEIIEFPLDDGRIFRSTRRQLNEFRKWLKNRENNG